MLWTESMKLATADNRIDPRLDIFSRCTHANVKKLGAPNHNTLHSALSRSQGLDDVFHDCDMDYVCRTSWGVLFVTQSKIGRCFMHRGVDNNDESEWIFDVECHSLLVNEHTDDILSYILDLKQNFFFELRKELNGHMKVQIIPKMIGGGSKPSKAKVRPTESQMQATSSTSHEVDSQSKQKGAHESNIGGKQHSNIENKQESVAETREIVEKLRAELLKSKSDLQTVVSQYESKLKEAENTIEELKKGLPPDIEQISETNPTDLVPHDLDQATKKDINMVLLEWTNYQLQKIGIEAKNLADDMNDGFFLIMLIEIVTGKRIQEYNSRLFADHPLLDETLILENKRILRNWSTLACQEFGLENSDEGSKEFQDLIKEIIWMLMARSVGHNSMFTETCQTRFDEARSLYQKESAPFPYEGFNGEKGSTILIRTCILLDKMEMIRHEYKGAKFKKWVSAPHRYKTTTELEAIIFDERVIRVFLSSTFRDMQNERDQFFQHGVVELKLLAKEIGIELVFIDLRWGLTSEDSSEGWVVIRCLDSIRKCPYFVCSLGARYGWIPDQDKTESNMDKRLEILKTTKPDATIKDIWIEWRTDTNKRFPFINSMPGLSVTEYEVTGLTYIRHKISMRLDVQKSQIQYAALIENPACSRVFFLFRDENYTVLHAKSEEERRLYEAESQIAKSSQDRLKENIKAKFGHVVYRGPKDYSDLVVHHLTYAIKRDFSNIKTRDPEDQAHHQFKMHRLAGFGGRREILKLISDRVISHLDIEDSTIIALAAQSGIGKSSIMAATSRELENMKHPGLSTVYHFVGCTNTSNYVESISFRFWKAISKEIVVNSSAQADDADYQKEGLYGLFGVMKTTNSNQAFVFLIDAVNQLHPSRETPLPHLLTWLPKKSPKNVAFLISTIDSHPSCKAAQEGGLDMIPVTKLTTEEIGDSVLSYLSRYDKTLSASQMSMILDDCEDTGHPLYLRIVLDEIRVFGVYEKLDSELTELLSPHGVVQLYSLIITRWQLKFNNPGSHIVDISMKVIYVSRIGLGESDLDNYMKAQIGNNFDLSEWKSFFFTLIESLFVRNGRYMYFHQLLAETTKEVFFSDPKNEKESHKEYGCWLFGQYSDVTSVDEELAAEICYQLFEGDCFELLVEYIKQEHVIALILGGRYRYEFFTYWRLLNDKGISNYKDIYRTFATHPSRLGDILVEFFLESHENNFLLSVVTQRMGKKLTDESKIHDYLTLGRIYKNLNNWTESMKHFTTCLGICRRQNTTESEFEAAICEEIGFVLQQENQLESALAEYQKVLRIRVQLVGPFDLTVADTHDRVGDLYLIQNKVELATAEFSRGMEIRSRKLGDEHPSIAKSLQKLGDAAFHEKRFAESLSFYEKSEYILEKSFGQKHRSVANILWSKANVQLAKKRKLDALALLQRSLDIYIPSNGENHPNTILCIELIGDIHHDMKNFSNALEAYTKTLEIRKRTLGQEHADYARSLENVGRTNFELNRLDQVAPYFHQASNIRRENDSTVSLSNTHQIGKILAYLKDKREIYASFMMYKAFIGTLMKNYSILSVVVWELSQELSLYCEQTELNEFAIDFFAHMKQIYEEKIGWTYLRTLCCCERLSMHSKKVGVVKEPYEFTRVFEFIQENIPGFEMETLLNKEKIMIYLLHIVYMSRTDETKSKAASDAITFLNFMDVSFTGLDLSGIRIPNANMSNSFVHGVNFTGADLTGVDFTDSVIENCVFNEAIMDAVRFGISFHLDGHKDEVSCVSSVTGTNGDKWIISGSIDNSIKVWSLDFGDLIYTLDGHLHSVDTVCVIQRPSGDNWLISSGRNDNAVHIWELKTGTKIQTLGGHISYVYCTCLMEGPNGESWLIVGCGDKSLHIWNIATGCKLKTLSEYPSYIQSICGIRGLNGEILLACASQDSKVVVLDLLTGVPYMDMKGYASYPQCLSSMTGIHEEVLLISGSDDNKIYVWDLDSGHQVEVLYGHTGDIRCLCCIEGPNGESWLASGGNDGAIRIWDLSIGVQITKFEGHKSFITSISWVKMTNGGHLLVSGSNDRTIRIWNFENIMRSLTFKKRLEAKLQNAFEIEGLNGEKWILFRTNDNLFSVWSVCDRRFVFSVMKEDLICTSNQYMAKKDIPREIIAKIPMEYALDIFGPGLAGVEVNDEVKNQKKNLYESSIQIIGTKGLSSLNKWSLFSVGAVSLDSDFLKFCQSFTCSDHQAAMVAECYENGWGVERNIEKALVWHGRNTNFERLRKFCREGLVAAFTILKGLAEERKAICNEYGSLIKMSVKYPMATTILAECYENGWSVERNIEKAVELHKEIENFIGLKELAKKGSREALDMLHEMANIKEYIGTEYEIYVHPTATAILAECYENGWGVERNIEKAVELYKETKNFIGLKELAKKGSREAFDTIQEMASSVKEILEYGYYGNKVGEKHDHPQAISLLAECFENGWGVEKDIGEAITLYGKGEMFTKIQEMVKNGSREAFLYLRECAAMKENEGTWNERNKYPEAIACLSLCYENGWCDELGELDEQGGDVDA